MKNVSCESNHTLEHELLSFHFREVYIYSIKKTKHVPSQRFVPKLEQTLRCKSQFSP